MRLAIFMVLTLSGSYIGLKLVELISKSLDDDFSEKTDKEAKL